MNTQNFLENQINNFKNEIYDLEKEKKRISSKNSNMIVSLDNHMNEIKNYKNEIYDLEKEIKRISSKNSNMIGSLNNHMNEIKKYKNEIYDLKKEIKRISLKNSNMVEKKTKNNFKNEIYFLQNEIKNITSKNLILINSQNNDKNEIKNLKNEIYDLEKEIKRISSKNINIINSQNNNKNEKTYNQYNSQKNQKPLIKNIYPKNILFQNSDLLKTPSEKNFIKKLFKKKIKKTNILYSEKYFKIRGKDFYKKCVNKGNILITILSKEKSKIFGAFIPFGLNSKKKDGKFYKINDSFLFSLTHKKKLDCFQNDFAVLHNEDDFPDFGGRDFSDLFLNGGNKESFSVLGDSYEMPGDCKGGTRKSRVFLAGSEKFTMQFIEVFQIIY